MANINNDSRGNILSVKNNVNNKHVSAVSVLSTYNSNDNGNNTIIFNDKNLTTTLPVNTTTP